MQILFHLGAHCTDDGLLIRSILRNREALAREGIGVPGPGRYRELVREVTLGLRGQPASAETEEMLIEAIRDDDTAVRIVLSNENFISADKAVLAPDALYPKAEKSAWLRNAVPSHEVEFAIGIRNPATFLPDLLARIGGDGTARLAGVSLGQLVWSDVVRRIAAANPGCRIVVWCHEDTPFIWGELLAELTQADPYTRLDGEFDMLDQIITEDGMTRFRDFLDSRHVVSVSHRRRAIAAFLATHAIEDRVAAEIDLPGWDDDVVATLTEHYDEDVALIGAIPGVRFIEP